MGSNITGLTLENGELIPQRPIHGGRVLARLKFLSARPMILSVRPKAFCLLQGDRQAKVERIQPALKPHLIRTRVMDRSLHQGERIELTEADVVISGGRGMKRPENFSLLENLAGLLKGAVGASRAVVDSQWRPQEEQVGKSGKTVSPDLYIACGISGAIHHIMGMDTSKVVVAINQDANALIFEYSDYGIVDDLFQVIPALIEEIKKKNG